MHRAHGLMTAALAFLVGVLATLLVARGHEVARAQDASTANYMIGLIGPAVRSDVPIMIVDTRAQTLMMYQWNTAREELQFLQARNYQYDRQIVEARKRGGMTVREAAEAARQQGGR